MMSRRVQLVLSLIAGVIAAFAARALGLENLISQAATVFVVFLLMFGGFKWSVKQK